MIGSCLNRMLHHRRYQRLLVCVCAFLASVFILLNLPGRVFRHPHQPPGLPLPDLGQVQEFPAVHMEVGDGDVFKKAQKGAPLLPVMAAKLPENLVNVPQHLSLQSTCPSCFGTDMCEEMEAGKVKIDLTHELVLTPGITVHQGYYQGHTQVWLKAYGQQGRFKIFEETLCLNKTRSKDCSVKDVIVNSFATSGQILRPERLKQQYKVAYKVPADLVALVCITESITEQFQDAMFSPGEIMSQDMAMFYTTLAVYPEVNNLKFLTNTKSDIPFPALLGVCGRSIVIENPGSPLISHLEGPWQLRADLALQLFYIIDSFVKDDDSVFLMYHGFQFDNVYVTMEGRVLLVSAHELGFFDKEAGEEYELAEGKLCNKGCLLTVSSELYSGASPRQQKLCDKAPTLAAHTMYAQLCKEVLSDLPEHKEPAPGRHPDKGLLHGLPQERLANFRRALRECVEETAFSGRLQAAEELQELLSLYATEHAL